MSEQNRLEKEASASSLAERLPAARDGVDKREKAAERPRNNLDLSFHIFGLEKLAAT